MTANEPGDLIDEILLRPAHTVAEPAITFDALTFLRLSDGAVVDRQAERQVHGFGRDLRQLAATLG